MNKYRRTLLICVSGTLLALFLLLVKTTNEFLLISANNADANGGPVTILDLGSGELSRPAISAVGCSGVWEDTAAHALEVYCHETPQIANVWDIDMRNFVTSPAKSPGYFAVKFHPQVIEGKDGWRFYNAGGPSLELENGFTDARIVAVHNDEVIEVPISNTSLGYFIRQMAYDPTTKVLWVMSLAEGAPTLIDRIDTTTWKIIGSSTIDTYASFDLAIYGGAIIVTHYRTEQGDDITVLDASNGRVATTLQLPVQSDESLNALSIVSFDRMVLVGGTRGFWKVTSDWKTQFIPNSQIGQATHIHRAGEYLYVISDYGQVLKLHEDNLGQGEIVFDGEGTGLTNVHYFVNSMRWYEKLYSHILSI